MLSSTVWSKVGHFSKALSKGPNTTTQIWNFHADAHDFDIQHANTARKVFASSLAHLSLVFLWIGGMHFHTAYFSSFFAWLKDPKHIIPSAHIVSQILNQDILSSNNGLHFQGIIITSGIFQLTRSCSIISKYHLQVSFVASILAVLCCILGSYSKMHQTLFPSRWNLLANGLISWCGHQIHISNPISILLDTNIDPEYIPCPQDLLFMQVVFKYNQLYNINPVTTSIFQHHIYSHHLYLAILFIFIQFIPSLPSALAFFGSSSIVFANYVQPLSCFPFQDYPTVLCLFNHHICIGSIFSVGAGAHASISMIRDNQLNIINQNHRDVIIGHLITICINLGFHSFSLYIHNDTFQALGHPSDIFSDTAIQLKPVFATFLQQIFFSFDIVLSQTAVTHGTQELGTADFLVHHIHTFTIHVVLLIFLKAILYARTSRHVPNKLELGFKYPCDGPGRGGTCQISAWDHTFLSSF
jgi:photosystem I P700 chlorophyll a apoprotein A1